MTKDYAKKFPHYEREKNNGSSLKIFVILCVIVLSGVFAYLKHFHQHPKKLHHHIAVQKPQPKETPNTELMQFDFYTVLPHMEVETIPYDPNADSKTVPAKQPSQLLAKKQIATAKTIPASVTTTKASAPASDGNFFLQIAASRNLAEAERYAAQLSAVEGRLLIQKIKIARFVWYRIMMGPYTSYATATAARKHIKQMNIESILLESK
jgi:cell division protein FtsN